MAKTAFTMQIVTDFLMQGKSVMYLGFEMKQDELMERMFCNYCEIDNFQLLTGKCHEYTDAWQSFQKKLVDFNFVATDEFGKTWRQLSNFLSNLSVPPDVIVLDYIQAVSQGAGKAFIDEYILNFRNLCIDRRFAGIIVSQLNRATQERKDPTPQLHDLKGSGYLEEIADLVLLLNWVGKDKDEPKFEVNVAKNRRGRTGYLELQYIPKWYKFRDDEYVETEAQIKWTD